MWKNMDRRFAKFNEVTVDYRGEKSSNELMIDVNRITAIRKTNLGTEIQTEDEDYDVIDSFEDVRKILAI